MNKQEDYYNQCKLYYDTPKWKKHFEKITETITPELINMSQHFDFHMKYFNFRVDSTMLHKSLYTPLMRVIEALEYKYGIGVKLCATSLYRKPYSVVGGRIDYIDLACTKRHTAHYSGMSMDLSFGMMEDKYKMKREYVKEALRNHGFSQPFAWEEWHWSYVK